MAMAEPPAPDEAHLEPAMPHAQGALREVTLDDALARRSSQRVRVFEAGVLLLLLITIAGLLLGPRIIVPQPAQSPTDQAQSIYVVSNVYSGTLTVNGRRLDGHPPMIARVRSGKNVITIAAAPFTPHTCTFVLDPAASNRSRVSDNRCMLLNVGTGGVPDQYATFMARLQLFIPFTGADLPPRLRASARSVIASALAKQNLHTVVPVGDYIATGTDLDGRITSQRASAPLRASASFTLASQTQSLGCDAADDDLCPEFRDTLNALTSQFASAWMVAVAVAVQWRFTTGAGVEVAASTMYPSRGGSLSLALEYDARTGTWRVEPLPGRGSSVLLSFSDALLLPACDAGYVQIVRYTPAHAHIDTLSPSSHRYAEGCQQRLRQLGSASVGSFLWRFGVLLAVDAEAHRLIPGIPLAPQAEIDAVNG